MTTNIPDSAIEQGQDTATSFLNFFPHYSPTVALTVIFKRALTLAFFVYQIKYRENKNLMATTLATKVLLTNENNT